MASIQQWIDRLPTGTQVFLLLSGANAHGMIDQWDDALVASHSDLERDVNGGKIQAIVQFGHSYENTKKLWTAQFVYSDAQAEQERSLGIAV
jgi:hypothetical protein